ncbi:MAG: hypothetical protein LBU14_04215 [Candidatus Peribacteria bacterium]|jgi:hypothetical protein|nr:hypothetical protein [Candidatus Peribacteria bacterium]
MINVRAATIFKIKSFNPTLLPSLFPVNETKNEVKFVPIFAQITMAKAFSYISQLLNILIIITIVPKLDCVIIVIINQSPVNNNTPLNQFILGTISFILLNQICN